MILKDKVILISGGTKGVGRGLAIECAKEGADVVFGGRDEETAKEIIKEVESKYNKTPHFVKTEILDEKECKRFVNEAISKFGKIDGLVNYAGILPIGDILNTDEALFDKVMNLNLKAAFFCAKYVIKNMQENNGGSLIFIGSAHGYGGECDRAAYAVSKGALLTLTHHIAKNYAANRIRANYVVMGWVATPGEVALRQTQGKDAEWLENEGRKNIPIGRLLTVEDHVPGIIYLLSDQAYATTGTELKITGGYSC